MAASRNHARPEPERQSWGPAMPYHDIQMRIGELMRWQYELPQELPHQLFALVRQVTGQNESE